MNKTAVINNRYQIIKSLGRGGFGETFLAIDTHLPSGKKCALKQLKPVINEPTIPQWMCDRFEQEARTLEYLGDAHRQIPSLYAYFEEQNNFYLVQEWIQGKTLTQIVEEKGVMSPSEVELFLAKTLPVLQFIHNQNIIHRDLKPDNIIYRLGDNLPVLIDFGAVKEAMTSLVNNQGNSCYSLAIGTPGYMAGEQAAGRPIFSSDLFALGLTAVYLLTGKIPQSLQTDSRSGEILWRRELPDLHSNLARVIDRAIRFNPRERFASVEEMLSELQDQTSSYSQVQTMVLGGKNQSVISDAEDTNFPEELNQMSTLAVKSFQEKKPRIQSSSSSELPNKLPNWLITFFPLISLSLVAIASFFLGYNTLIKENPDLTVEQQTVPYDEFSDNDNYESEPETLDQNQEEFSPDSIASSSSLQEQPSEIIPQSNDLPAEEKSPQSISRQKTVSDETSIPIPIQQAPTAPTKNLSVAVVGTPSNQLEGKFGKPDLKVKGQGLLHNTTQWSYPGKSVGIRDVNYVVDKNTTKVKQTEITFSSDAGLEVISSTVEQLTNHNYDSNLTKALTEVVQGNTDLRSFNAGEFRGMIQKKNDHIYLKVWDADFP